MKKKFFGFEKNVFFLSVTSFLTDVSSEIIYPLLPLFLTSVLGAGAAFVGLVEGIAESTASILKLFSGWFSDKIKKRKALVVFGYALSSITRPLMALAMAPWNVLVIRFADRIGKGIRNSPRDALIADSCGPDERGKAFGFNRAMDHAGAMLGSLALFILLLGVTKNYRLIFAFASVPALLAVVVVAFFTREAAPAVRHCEEALPKAGRERSEAKPPRRGRSNPKNRDCFALDTSCQGLAMTGKFKLFLLAVLIFTLGNSSDAFLLLRAKDLGVSIAFIPLLWFLLHVVKSAASTPSGIISDRIGRRRLILSGWLIYGLVYLGFGFAKNSFHIWVLFAIYGLFYGLTEGVERALVADLAPQETRGRAYGVYNFIIGIAALPASVLMGILWQTFGPAAAFLLGAGLALAASIMLILCV